MVKSYKPKKFTTKKFNLNKRETRTQRGYTNEWYRYRAKFLKQNPKCYACGSRDRLNVDHIIVHRKDQEKFWDIYNFIPLCHSCHSTVTANFDRHEVQLVDDKIAWLQHQRKINGIRTQVKVVPL